MCLSSALTIYRCPQSQSGLFNHEQIPSVISMPVFDPWTCEREALVLSLGETGREVTSTSCVSSR